MRLKEIRKEKGLTQKEIAALLDMPRSTYNEYEHERRDLPTKVLMQLAAYYRTSCDDLLGFTGTYDNKSIAI